MTKLIGIVGGLVLVLAIASVFALAICAGFNWAFTPRHVQFRQVFFVICALASLRLPAAVITAWRSDK